MCDSFLVARSTSIQGCSSSPKGAPLTLLDTPMKDRKLADRYPAYESVVIRKDLFQNERIGVFRLVSSLCRGRATHAKALDEAVVTWGILEP